MIAALAKGIFKERNRIFDFFHDLPLNILRALAATARVPVQLREGTDHRDVPRHHRHLAAGPLVLR